MISFDDTSVGPWSYDQRLIYDNSPYGPLATVHRNQADAARIVACVNACEGMDDPAAEIALLRFTIKRMGAERDEALDALARQYARKDEQHIGTCDGSATRCNRCAVDAATEIILRKHGRLD